MSNEITTASRLDGNAHGSPAQAIAFARAAGAVDAEAYLNRIYARAAAYGIDPLLAVAQSAEETARWTSARWTTNRNPAGLAIVQPGDPDPGAWTSEQAADMHLLALSIAMTKGRAPGPSMAASTPGGTAFVNRWLDKYADPNCPRVATLADLCRHYTDKSGEAQATWAWDTTYADQIAAIANAILATKGAPMSTPSAAPRILITAGHRNTTGGNAEEASLTPITAHHYRDALRAAGYHVDYWQEIDGDADPDYTDGSLDVVAKGCLIWGQQLPAGQGVQGILLDLHYEGEAEGVRGCFAIVPDEAGLGSAAPNSTPGDDTWANNPADQALGRAVAQHIAQATGLQLRTVGVVEPGLMSERQTGVGEEGYRLAMFAWTAPVRDRMIRLVIEHGNHTDSHDHAIIFGANFQDQVAGAVVQAIESLYPAIASRPTSTTPAPTTTTTPSPYKPPTFAHNPDYVHNRDTKSDWHQGNVTWWFLGGRRFRTVGRTNLLTEPTEDNGAPKAGPTLDPGHAVAARFGGRVNGFDYVILAADSKLGIPEGAVTKANNLDPQVSFDRRPS